MSAFKLARVSFRPLYLPSRSKSSRTTLGAPPDKARCLSEKLKDLSVEDPAVHYKVNIGYALKKLSRKDTVAEHVKLLKENKKNKDLELLARNNQLVIPINEVDEVNSDIMGPVHCRAIAEHYGVYQHLFGDAYFHPVVNMEILYADETVPVFRGNVVKPAEATKQPSVRFQSKPDDLWTLVMTTPDGTSNDVERIHWMVANIKGSDVACGEEICQHIQPLPFEGLGYLRYIFVLYKQEGKIDYADLAKQLLTTRFFSTQKFYAKREDVLTPAGLAFFTSTWDSSVNDYYHTALKQDPPVFEYDFPDHYYKKQVWFPLKQPFNLYLDRYRDEKEIAKEYLIKKLKKTDPFKGDLRPKYPFPNAIPIPEGTPAWLANEIKKERLGRARAADYS
ncbi:hypothetical protein GE061_009030 [Apolygus lucorum]|uniref:Uncharacterized protein n=1 Tax=Apolygus lucorum TaxID=248454 RepID=A0A6A4JS70_APOLU|nr:hypothetical protein GE061_009030 [Apolygus lucorum]